VPKTHGSGSCLPSSLCDFVLVVMCLHVSRLSVSGRVSQKTAVIRMEGDCCRVSDLWRDWLLLGVSESLTRSRVSTSSHGLVATTSHLGRLSGGLFHECDPIGLHYVRLKVLALNYSI